jgi:hypothetical protein
MSLKDITITGSINSQPSLSYGQKTYIASTDEQSFPIEHITGSAGGATPDFNGQVYTTNLFVNITQSWSGSNNTPAGIVPFVHDTEEEFINGEYSGSFIQVTDQRLIDPECVEFLTVNTTPVNYEVYFYLSSGSGREIPLGNFLDPNTTPNDGEIYIYWLYDPPTYVPGNPIQNIVNPYSPPVS